MFRREYKKRLFFRLVCAVAASNILGYDDFVQVAIRKIQFSNPNLANLVPLNIVTIARMTRFS